MSPRNFDLGVVCHSVAVIAGVPHGRGGGWFMPWPPAHGWPKRMDNEGVFQIF
jgi:hypothetical protein